MKKTLSALLIGLMMAGTFVFSHVPALLADEDEHSAADIQVLKDAAAALLASKPELSAKLTAYADRESKEMAEDKDADEKK